MTKTLTNKKHHSIIIFAAIFAALITILAFSGCKEEKKEQTGPTGDAPTVKISTVLQKTVPIYGEYVATIDPSTGAEIVNICARVEAFLLEQHYLEGRPVHKGQLLFTLDSRSYEADLKTAIASLDKGKADLLLAENSVDVNKSKADLVSSKAQLALAEVNLKRLKPLAEKKAVPQQDYDNAVTNEQVARANVTVAQANLQNAILSQKVSIEQAKAEIETANAAISRAEINLSYCTITSPIDGIAGKRLVSPGNLVGHGEATLLTTVANLDPLRVNFNISETDYLKIAKVEINDKEEKGDEINLPPLELILADGSIYNHKGKIFTADPTIDSKTGTYNIVGEFANPQYLLRPGMFGRMRLQIGTQKDALIIPQKAIITLQSSKTVYVVDNNNKVVLRSVIPADEVKDMIIITSGVKAGERVIVEGQLKVYPDMVVKPIDDNPSGEKGEK